MQNSEFREFTLLNLGTRTPGGLPLPVPDKIINKGSIDAVLQELPPAYKPGTYRTCANPGIGTLGLIAAKSMGQEFAALLEQRLFPGLGRKSSYINVPAVKMPDYAQGYTQQETPIRMAAGVLTSETYAIRTTTATTKSGSTKRAAPTPSGLSHPPAWRAQRFTGAHTL